MRVERLAIDGGPAKCAGCDWKRTLLGAEERAAVLELMDRSIAGGLAFDRYGGTEVDAYEREFAAFAGCAAATAVSSGTAAIHSALAALHLEPGSEVICPPITDPGSIAPVLMQQCIPVFADTAPESFNVSAPEVEAVWSEHTAAVIAAHIMGEAVDMAPLAALARERGVPLIEDCAQAHGAGYRGQPVGSLGDAGAFSLMGGKHHTAGGQGGMVVSDDAALILEAKRFADRGKPFGAEATEAGSLFLGLNYRMTELEAAIGRVQLRKLPRIVARRRRIVARLRELLAPVPAVVFPPLVARSSASWWFIRLRIDPAHLRVDHDRFAAALAAEGVPCRPRYRFFIYRQPWIRERRTFGESQLPWSLPGRARPVDYEGSCPHAEETVERCLLLSLNESCTDDAVEAVAAAVIKVAAAYAA